MTPRLVRMLLLAWFALALSITPHSAEPLQPSKEEDVRNLMARLGIVSILERIMPDWRDGWLVSIRNRPVGEQLRIATALNQAVNARTFTDEVIAHVASRLSTEQLQEVDLFLTSGLGERFTEIRRAYEVDAMLDLERKKSKWFFHRIAGLDPERNSSCNRIDVSLHHQKYELVFLINWVIFSGQLFYGDSAIIDNNKIREDITRDYVGRKNGNSREVCYLLKDIGVSELEQIANSLDSKTARNAINTYVAGIDLAASRQMSAFQARYVGGQR